MINEVAKRYAVAIPEDLTETEGPVARQYLPSAEELTVTARELEDPIGDEAHSPVKGIVHRYPDRVLLKAVHVCSVYCRFCFRREMVGPGKSEALDAAELAAALDYIRKTPQVWEVILTGGDPFVLSARRLKEIMTALEGIDHVKVIRFHTRVPVADPSRVTEELVAALESGKAVYVTVHCNHADELTEKARAALRKISKAGIPLLSQSVLLRGVNDSAAALENLFRALVELRVKPYYLHHPDLAPGTSHFRLPIEEGRALTAALEGKLSGIARPRYVLDIPGGHGKVSLAETRVEKEGAGYKARNWKGEDHAYLEDHAHPLSSQ